MLIFELNIPPTPNRQARFSRKTGVVYNPNKKLIKQIQWQLKPYAPSELLRGRLEVFYTFYMPIPVGTSSVKRRQMLNGIIGHTKRPDVDNLAYIVTNALTGLIYADDSQITHLHMCKLYDEKPRTVIKINPMYDSEQTVSEEI